MGESSPVGGGDGAGQGSGAAEFSRSEGRGQRGSQSLWCGVWERQAKGVGKLGLGSYASLSPSSPTGEGQAALQML